MTETMQAVQIHEYGGLDVLKLEAAPKPVPTENEVLIRVAAAGINPVDTYARAGGVAGMMGNDPFPLILGWDVSGVIEQAPAESGFQAGDAVYSMVNFPGKSSTYAEYVTAKLTDIAHAPQAIPITDAAAVPLVALTAWQVLFEAGNLQAGQRVLIHAAAGGVGHIAVQLAKWKGATVIGTASAQNADYLRQLGVDEFIDYTEQRYEDVVSDVDLVFDCVGGDTMARSIPITKQGGTVITIAGQPEADEKDGVRLKRVLVRSSGEQLAEIARLMDAGHVKPTVAHRFPLAQAAQAHELQASRHVRGKIILTT